MYTCTVIKNYGLRFQVSGHSEVLLNRHTLTEQSPGLSDEVPSPAHSVTATIRAYNEIIKHKHKIFENQCRLFLNQYQITCLEMAFGEALLGMSLVSTDS